MRARRAVLAVAVVATAAAGCASTVDGTPAAGSGSAVSTPATSGGPSAPGTSASVTTPPPGTSASGAEARCSWVPDGDATRTVDPPPVDPPDTGTVTVDVTTNRGDLAFTLNRAATPCTVASFLSLAQQSYFDDTPCHRLTTSGIFVLQCGDPSGTGTGGPGYRFADELSGNEQYTAGVVAMANAGPDTNGSQFFIVYENSQLPPSYTVFGTVDAAGLKVVDKIAAGGSTPPADGKPNLPVVIDGISPR